MYHNKLRGKTPGDLLPLSRKEGQGSIDDLGKRQIFELEEILARENRILANTKFLSKLPDKGEKIKAFRDKVEKELNHKNEVKKAADLLSRLNLASEGKAAMNELEWTNEYSEERNTEKIVTLDSDDEEDPLKILAQPTGTGFHKKKIIHVAPEESLIKSEDLAEIDSFKSNEYLKEEYIKHLVEKVEKSAELRDKKRESFKPYKTTKSNVHDPEKEKKRKLNNHWEVTAATPPLIVHGAAKVLYLNESLELQKQQAKNLKEVQTKHAAEKLAEQLGLHTISSLPENVTGHSLHVHDSSSSNSDNEEDEIHDEEDNDKQGTVVFTVDTLES